MGLIKAGIGALGGVLADQWREYFYCDSLEAEVLAAKGVKRSSRRSSNKKGSENVITNGSIIAVNDGQCMMIVEQGKVVEFSAEPGEFVWDSSTEPTIFYGGFGEGLGQSWETLKKRFTFGGDTGKDQRVYFFNTKEVMGNKYGTANPVPFRVVDSNVGLDMDIALRCCGEYSYRIVNPMLFYKNVCGNIDGEYSRDELDSQLKSELLTALQPAFSQISAQGVRYSAIPGHTMEIADALNNILSAKWRNLRGIEVASFGVTSLKASEEDEAMIKELQRNAAFKDPTMAAAQLASAQAAAMQAAARNENAGPAMAFMGMGMAQNMGGMNTQGLYQMGQQNAPAPQNVQAPLAAQAPPTAQSAGMAGTVQGAPAQESTPAAEGWTCACGHRDNKGKFCPECGAKKPAGAPLYRCDKCGWEPADPKNPPKFCPECGDRFDENDMQ